MKTAIIGVGRMGRRHVQAAQELGLSIVGVCDQSPDALKICEHEHNIPSDKQFNTAESMLQETKPDCVIISTTAPTHCEYTCLAADYGAKYILCEKPMAVSLAQCDRMIRVCKQNDAKLAINHQMRFMEQYTETKKIINSNEFGGLCSITIAGGNFGLAMNGTHYFEMFRYMTDEKPHEVTAWFSEEKVSNPRGPQFEDRAGAVRITTAKGRRLYIEAGADQGHGIKGIFSGRYGQVIVDQFKGMILLSARKEEDRNLPTTQYGTASVDSECFIQPVNIISSTKSVLDALRCETNYPTGEDGRLAVATLIAAYCSHEQGHTSIIIDDKNLPMSREFSWA